MTLEHLKKLAALVPGDKIVLLGRPHQVRVVRHIRPEKQNEKEVLRIRLEPAFFFGEAVLCMGGDIEALSDEYRILDDTKEVERLERENPYHLLPKGKNFLMFREQRP